MANLVGTMGIAVGGVKILNLDGDPSIGAGYSAPSGSLALIPTGAMYTKDAGAVATDWTVAGGAAGDVTAAAVMADHTLIRGDGGAKGIQDSGITVNDVDSITGVNDLSVLRVNAINPSGVIGAVYAAQSGANAAFRAVISTSLTAQAFRATEDNAARANAMIDITSQPLRVADVMKIHNVAVADNVDSLAITQWGGGHAVHTWCGTYLTNSAFRATEDDVARTVAMVDLVAEASRVEAVIKIVNPSAAASIDVGAGNITGTGAWLVDGRDVSADGAIVDVALTAAAVVGAAQLVIGAGGGRDCVAGGWTITAGGDLVVGARGDSLDLGGDFVPGTTGEGIYSPADTELRIQGGGNTYFYTNATQRLTIGSAITAYVGITERDNLNLSWGSAADAVMSWRLTHTPDTLMMGLSAASRSLVICEKGDIAYDFAHPLQTNPTVFINSSNQSATEWLSLAHNQTLGVIASGTGGIQVEGWTFDKATGDLVVGARGDKLDLSGDLGEHWVSSGDGIVQLWTSDALRVQYAASAITFSSRIAPHGAGVQTCGYGAVGWKEIWCNSFGHVATLSDTAVGIVAQNSLAASGGIPDRWSPTFTHEGQAWTGAASIEMQMGTQLQTVNAATPTAKLVFWENIADAGYNVYAYFKQGGSLYLAEQAAADIHEAAYGQHWILNSAPALPMYQDDADLDYGVIVTPSATGTVHRQAVLVVTGTADNTTCTAQLIDDFNGEALAVETIDTDTPAGGTRFDISADGQTITVKGMTKVALTSPAHHIHSSDSGTVWHPHADVAGGKLTVGASVATTGAAVDFSAAALNGKVIAFGITYLATT